MNERDIDKYPFASPTIEYCRFKGYEHARDIEHESEVTNRDLLVAFLRSADAIFHELRCIRDAVEKHS